MKYILLTITIFIILFANCRAGHMPNVLFTDPGSPGLEQRAIAPVELIDFDHCTEENPCSFRYILHFDVNEDIYDFAVDFGGNSNEPLHYTGDVLVSKSPDTTLLPVAIVTIAEELPPYVPDYPSDDEDAPIEPFINTISYQLLSIHSGIETEIISGVFEDTLANREQVLREPLILPTLQVTKLGTSPYDVKEKGFNEGALMEIPRVVLVTLSGQGGATSVSDGFNSQSSNSSDCDEPAGSSSSTADCVNIGETSTFSLYFTQAYGYNSKDCDLSASPIEDVAVSELLPCLSLEEADAEDDKESRFYHPFAVAIYGRGSWAASSKSYADYFNKYNYRGTRYALFGWSMGANKIWRAFSGDSGEKEMTDVDVDLFVSLDMNNMGKDHEHDRRNVSTNEFHDDWDESTVLDKFIKVYNFRQTNDSQTGFRLSYDGVNCDVGPHERCEEFVFDTTVTYTIGSVYDSLTNTVICSLSSGDHSGIASFKKMHLIIHLFSQVVQKEAQEWGDTTYPKTFDCGSSLGG